MNTVELRGISSPSGESFAHAERVGPPPPGMIPAESTGWVFVEGPNIIAVQADSPTVWRYESRGFTVYRTVPAGTRGVRSEGIPLAPLGISPEQAADFRAQVGKLTEDWDDPAMSVYDDA